VGYSVQVSAGDTALVELEVTNIVSLGLSLLAIFKMSRRESDNPAGHKCANSWDILKRAQCDFSIHRKRHEPQ
jgi:hypothetical protein